MSERGPSESDLSIDPSEKKAIPGFDDEPAGQIDKDPDKKVVPGLEDDEDELVDPASAEGDAVVEGPSVAGAGKQGPGQPAIEGPAKPAALPLPFAPPVERAARVVSAEDAAIWKRRIESLVAEARARPGDASSVVLWFEAGRIFESELGDLRTAITHYQEAFKVDPTYVPVIHAARRVFALVKQWAAVVMLLGKEVEIEGSELPPLQTEIARIYEAKLNQRTEAARYYRLALESDAAYAPAVEGLRRYLDEERDYLAMAKMLREAADRCPTDPQKIAWLVAAGRVFESRLGDDASAQSAFEAARELGKDRLDVLHALRRLYARQGDSASHARVLAEIALRSEPHEAVRFLQERAQLLLREGDEDAAIETLIEARVRNPQDTLVLRELGQLLQKREDWAELEAVLDAQAGATRDLHERIALHAEAGRLCEQHLRAPERAISHFHACLELDKGFQPALTALGKLYARAQRWQELIEVYSIELEAVDERQKVTVLFRQAELLASEMDDTPRAIENLRAVLEIEPAYLPANKLLAGLYIKSERWAELVDMYEQELAALKDTEQALFLLEKIGRLYEHQLASLDEAIRAYTRMLEWQAGYLPALRALGRLYAKSGRWEALLEINAEEAEIVGDMGQVVSLLFKNGEILADKLEQPEGAIDAFRRVLVMQPNYLPALRALGRMYARSQRWDDLVAMHRDEHEVARTPGHRATLLANVAEIYEKQLNDLDKAAETWTEILEEIPNYQPAIRALARYAQQSGDNDRLVELLRVEIGLLSDPRDRGLLRCRVADLLDRALDRPADAAIELEGAIKDVPSLLEAHERLVSLHTRRGLDALEAEARERMHSTLPDAASRAANLRGLGHLYVHRLDKPEQAAATYNRLLEDNGADRGARGAALSCALRARDYRGAIKHAMELAEVESDRRVVAELHMSIANWKSAHLDPPEDPLRSYLRALEYEPLHPLALRQVESLYLEREEWTGLYELYQREHDAAMSRRQEADLAVKMGELAERRLDDADLAIQCYERALKAVPEFLPAIGRLQDVFERLQRPQDKVRLLALEARASKDEKHAIETLLEVASLHRDRFGDVDAATEAFFSVLERDPQNQTAYNQLEGLLVSHERWQQLAELYWRRADAVEDRSSKVEFLTRAAQLAEEKLEDQNTATAIYEQVILASPTHPPALARLGELRYLAGKFEGARTCFETLLSSTNDPNLSGPAHYRLGVIFDEHQPDPLKAVSHLAAALKANPAHRKAMTRLAGAHSRAENFEEAVALYEKLVATAPTPEEAQVFRISLARLHEEAFADFGKAAEQYDAAIAATTDPKKQMDLVQRATGLYERSGNLDGYLSMAERQAEQLSSSSPADAAALFGRCAQLRADKKSDTAAALALAQRAIDLAPGNLEVRGLLADLLSAEPNQLATAVEQHRRILRAGNLRASSLHALFAGWSRSKARDRAFVAAELLCFLGSSNEAEEQFYADNKKDVSEGIDEALEAPELTSWVVHPDQRNVVHEILSMTGTELTKLEPDDLTQFGIEKKDILKARSNERLRALADELARVFGGFNFEVRRTRVRGHSVEAKHGSPVVLIVGHEIERSYRPREQRFLLGSSLFQLRTGQHLIAGKTTDDLRALLTAIARSVDKGFRPLLEGGDVDALTKKVGGSISRGLRKQLSEPVQQLAEERDNIDLDKFMAAVPFTAARGGLVLSNELAVACRMLTRRAGKQLPAVSEELFETLENEPSLMDLVSFALSDGYFSARQRLRVAIDA